MAQPSLLPRTDPALDNTPIHVDDVVHLRAMDGSTVKARVIYNTALDGIVTYTTELVTRMTESGRVAKLRFRFRHEHVHGIEPARADMHRALSMPSPVHSFVKINRMRKLKEKIAARLSQLGRFGKSDFV